MPGGSTSGGRGFWADALRAALDAAASKYASGRPADVPPPPKPAPGEQPRQQTAPPLTAEQQDLLNRINNKLNAQAQAKPGQQAGVPPGALPGQDKPGGQQQQTVPQGDPEQRTLLRKILESISKAVTAPMDFARKGFEKLNRVLDEPDEVIEEGRRQGGFRGRLKAGVAGVVKGLGQQSPLQGIGSISGAAGDVVGGVPMVGKPAESFFKLNEVVLKSVDRLRKWTDQIHAGNIQFAEFSGKMLAVQKQMEAREIRLAMQKGEALADSAKFNAEQKSRLDNQLFNIEVAWQRMNNTIGGYIQKWAADFLKQVPLVGRGEAADLGPRLHEWMTDLTENEANKPDSLIPPPKRWGFE